jgi:hypothetical protein
VWQSSFSPAGKDAYQLIRVHLLRGITTALSTQSVVPTAVSQILRECLRFDEECQIFRLHGMLRDILGDNTSNICSIVAFPTLRAVDNLIYPMLFSHSFFYLYCCFLRTHCHLCRLFVIRFQSINFIVVFCYSPTHCQSDRFTVKGEVLSVRRQLRTTP